MKTYNHSPLKLYQDNAISTYNNQKIHGNALLKKIVNKFSNNKCKQNNSMEVSYNKQQSIPKVIDIYDFSKINVPKIIHNSTNSKEKNHLKLLTKNIKLDKLPNKHRKFHSELDDDRSTSQPRSTNALYKITNHRSTFNTSSKEQECKEFVTNQSVEIVTMNKNDEESIPMKLNLDENRTKDMLEICLEIQSHWAKSEENLLTELKYYKVGKLLGRGAFGMVNLGIHKLTGKFVAIKSIHKNIMTDESSKNKVMKEVAIWEQLRHKSIIRLYETFESKKYLHYIEEFCAGGDLLTYVRKRKKLKEDIAKFILKQILEGLYYCHSKSILHRDIKLDNILINLNGMIKVSLIINRYVILE